MRTIERWTYPAERHENGGSSLLRDCGTDGLTPVESE